MTEREYRTKSDGSDSFLANDLSTTIMKSIDTLSFYNTTKHILIGVRCFHPGPVS